MRAVLLVVVCQVVATTTTDHSHYAFIGPYYNLTNVITSGNTNIDFSNTLEYYSVDEYYRIKREAHSLIGPFDLTKLFKKKQRLKEEMPSVASLHSREVLTERQLALTAFTDPKDNDDAKNVLDTTVFTEDDVENYKSKSVPNTKVDEKGSVVRTTTMIPKRKNDKSRLDSKGTGKRKAVRRTSTTVPPGIEKSRSKVSRKSKSVSSKSLDGGERLISKKKTENETVWPIKNAAIVEGDIVLGGLMMVCLFVV
ncbi:unnamed protein product [Leptosia nina]|uniref:Uncharacterized protein n=1 Tax=Leptosia nina TaxID=320188 RepID=A0AAV1JZC6_9NEOP